MRPDTSDTIAGDWLHTKIQAIEECVDMDALTIFGPIVGNVDYRVRQAIENLPDRRDKLLVIIDTVGGIMEMVERIANTIRHHYEEVKFVVPDRAMSAGTVLVMSGDAILMDYFSCLGPVDPQLYIEGKPIPTSVISYLEQYDRFVEKSREGELTSAELVLLHKLDPADLRQYELVAALSVRLIRDWLVKYKFKDWKRHSSSGKLVTDQEKNDRANQIAQALSNQERWGTHSRGINKQALADLKLQIDDLESDPVLSRHVKEYFLFLRDFANQRQFPSIVHSRCFL